ncbi:MAG TPA: phosphopantetheine-binding protein [Syntrophomonadaceae bacterium]|nr:phosphopantetheine-binding protein [Syntrophomonadaceae bacterium]
MVEKLLEILYEIRPEVDFLNSSNFIENRLLDSLDIVVLVSDIEEAFAISIHVNDIVPENFYNLETITKLIARRGGQI